MASPEERPTVLRRLLGLSVLVLTLLLAGCQATGLENLVGDRSSDEHASGLAVDATDGSLLKAARGLFRSVDGGGRWEQLPLPSSVRPERLRQVVAPAAAPSKLYAAGPGAGVVGSDDRGRTWRAIGGGLPSQEVAALAVHESRPDTLYAWIEGQGVFRTEDGGGRWQKMDDGPGPPVAALVHSPLEGSMNTGWLYAATPDGPYLSMDCF